jgi:organic hydroperoxide reductase OsmC/OhrA
VLPPNGFADSRDRRRKTGPMQPLPHHYVVVASAAEPGEVCTRARGLPELRVSSPLEFGGPGDQWSPETLLVAAVADCFILTFRAVARASSLSWTALECDTTGTLDAVNRVMQFTSIEMHVRLSVPGPVDPERARRALQQAERGCLVRNSLKPNVLMTADVVVESAAADAVKR